jgi:predicted nucleic acid-binding protein
VKGHVIDASVAVKWVVEETGTADALALRQRGRLIAPELLIAECANILWKKVRREELSKEEAVLAARLLEGADIELVPMRSLLEVATSIAIELDHPAYDCVYIALAQASDCQFVTADERLLRKLDQIARNRWCERVISLAKAATSLPGSNA